jgi:hypothetical protein
MRMIVIQESMTRVQELRARPRSLFETEFRMAGAERNRALHTRLADADDEATAAGRVTTSCLRFCASGESKVLISVG